MIDKNKKIEIVILGTGTSQGVPVMGCNCQVCLSTKERDKRLRTSVLVRTATTAFTIDCGPDFRQQMLRENVQKLDAVVFTHEHQDHVAGLDELRSFIFKNKKPMPLLAEERIHSRIKQLVPYAFEENPYPGAPQFQLKTLQENAFKLGDVHIEPLRAMHGELPVLGFRIGDFAYFTDVNFLPESTIAAIENIPVLVIDALHHQPHHSHFNLQQALQAIEKIKPQKAFLTHISHSMGLHDEVNKLLPENVALAFDGLRFTF